MPAGKELGTEVYLERARVIALNTTAYRIVVPEHPLPPRGPSEGDCASTGSYRYGARMNAKWLHGALYTALHPLIAVIEAMDPPHGPSPDEAGRVGLKEVHRGRYQLFKISGRLEKVLDLTQVPRQPFEHLVHPYSAQHASCRLLSKMTHAQRIGWKALRAGHDGILRPSAAFWRRWGEKAARRAPVLDILCPNLRSKLTWELVKESKATPTEDVDI